MSSWKDVKNNILELALAKRGFLNPGRRISLELDTPKEKKKNEILLNCEKLCCVLLNVDSLPDF